MEKRSEIVSLPSVFNFSAETPYDYLVVPHHGGKLDYAPLGKHVRDDMYYSIVSGNKGTNRPAAEHQKALNDGGYEVWITEDANEAIVFSLVKGCVIKNL